MTLRRVIYLVNPSAWLVVLAAIALWQVLVDAGVLDFSYLPAPSGVADGLSELSSEGALLPTVGHTLGVTLLASAIAVVLGVAVGGTMGLIGPVRTYTMGTFDVMRTVPVVALMPVALLIWGPAGKTEVIVATYSAVWPVLINTAAAVRAVHPRLRDVARTFRLSRADTVRKIILPAATPAMLVGGRLAVVTALVVAIVAEMLINPEGIGWELIQAQNALRPDLMWAWAVVSGVLGYLLNVVLIQAVRRGGANIGPAGAS